MSVRGTLVVVVFWSIVAFILAAPTKLVVTTLLFSLLSAISLWIYVEVASTDKPDGDV